MQLHNPKHRKKLKHYNTANHAHELTFSCYHKFEYLKDPVVCEIFVEEIEDARKNLHFKLWAWVLMPNHVHVLLYPEYEEYDMAVILQSIKGKTATHYREYILENHPDRFEKFCVTSRGKRVFRLWQPGGGFDRNLFTAEAIHASITYIEGNPVRAEYVEKPEEWPWSSARARKLHLDLMPDMLDVPFR